MLFELICKNKTIVGPSLAKIEVKKDGTNFSSTINGDPYKIFYETDGCFLKLHHLTIDQLYKFLRKLFIVKCNICHCMIQYGEEEKENGEEGTINRTITLAERSSDGWNLIKIGFFSKMLSMIFLFLLINKRLDPIIVANAPKISHRKPETNPMRTI